LYRPVSLNKNKRIFVASANKITKIFASFMLVFLFLSNPVLALTSSQQAQLDAIDQQNASFRAQLDALYSQERTLANEIAIADAQAAALQAQINDTQTKINITNEQLTTTAEQIKAAEDELTRQKANLNEYIKVMYMDGRTSQLELVLTSNNFSDFVDKSEYLTTMQSHIQETMTQINTTKAELEAKKKQLDEDKAKLDVLKEGQLSQISAMNSQISYKSQLLSGNQNSQDSIAAKIAENNANSYIIRCLASGACGGSANGDLVVVNNVQPYYAQTSIPGTYDGYHTYAYYGCLITSLAMAHGLYPTAEAANHRYDSEGNMYGDSTSGRATDWATANSVLARGGKVVIGLNIGHFVLAVGYSNGKYLINDPYPGLASSYDRSQVTKLLLP